MSIIQAAFNSRAFRRSAFARPYIVRLINFRRFTCPSTLPFIRAVDYT
jgi:hypothetical protein